MATLDVTACDDFTSSLDELAGNLLCSKSDHRAKQGAGVARRWGKDISDFAVEEEMRLGREEEEEDEVMGRGSREPDLAAEILAVMDSLTLLTEVKRRLRPERRGK